MPSTLRRPMFRGGPVKSEGTGITSGLDQGYADGGRVALGFGGFLKNLFTRSPAATTVTTANAPLSGYALKSNVGTNVPVSYPGMSYSDIIGAGDVLRTAQPYLANPLVAIPALGYGAYQIGRLPGRVTDSGYLMEGGEEEQFIKDYGAEILGKETSTGEAIEGYYLTKNQKRAADLLKRGEPGDKEMAQKLLKSSTPDITKNGEKIETEAEKMKKNYEAQIEALKKAHADELAKLTGTTDSGEGDIAKYAKEARDLLGYEEAKKQSIYDALLAASPGFFKGRNLREAAPNILESINKSGAFDKPTNIKQAAAQLAIQRKMLQEKAIAEEKTRYGLLEAREGLKSKSPIERLKALGGDPSTSWGGNLPSNRELLKPGFFYQTSDGKLVKAVKDEKTKLVIPILYE